MFILEEGNSDIVVILFCHFSILKNRNNGDPLICGGSGEIC